MEKVDNKADELNCAKEKGIMKVFEPDGTYPSIATKRKQNCVNYRENIIELHGAKIQQES